MIKRSAAGLLLLIFISLSMLNCKASNGNADFPENCIQTGFKYKNNGVTLNTDSKSSQGLYLLNNKSDSDYWVTHPVKDPSASAGWTSDINPGNWSAFTSNMPEFELTCMKTGQSSMETLSCEKVLRVCRIQDPVFKPDMTGNYWVSEDKPLQAVLDEIKGRGIGY